MRAPSRFYSAILLGDILSLTASSVDSPSITTYTIVFYTSPEEPTLPKEHLENFASAFAFLDEKESTLHTDPPQHRYQPWWVASEKPNPRRHTKKVKHTNHRRIVFQRR